MRNRLFFFFSIRTAVGEPTSTSTSTPLASFGLQLPSPAFKLTDFRGDCVLSLIADPSPVVLEEKHAALKNCCKALNVSRWPTVSIFQ
mmetsp:Transcript_68065/g.114384  ORF Transcript_68065/g.114384 Transcript_68065/m.114384 type:complete len:88 (-) Transcript_68065:1138-1401(-)